MGTILSSNKDYNPVLINRPRKSIDIAKFDVPDKFFQPSLGGTLSIPAPVLISDVNNLTPSSLISNQTPAQPDLPPTITDQTNQQQIEPMYRSSSHSFQPKSSIYNPPTHNDALIVSRSVVNMNKHDHHRQGSHNPHLSSFRSNRSIVERNGKQFITEFNERVEKRYVQVYDQSIGRMRLFEVTDYIPSRTVRAMKTNTQLPNFSLNSRLPLPPISNNSTKPINLPDSKALNNRDTIAREFDMYHSGANIQLNNNNIDNTNTDYRPNPPLQTQPSNDSNYTQPRSNTYSKTVPVVPDQYTTGSYRSQPTSFRPHSPTASDYSVETESDTSDNASEESDSEGIDPTSPSSSRRTNNNPNNSNVAYGTLNGQYTSTAIDPFRRTVNTHDPYYKKRPTTNNYSEPIANNRQFPRSTDSDYTPIPTSYNQANRNQYAYRGDSSAYDG